MTTIGYVTVTYADEYVDGHFLSTDTTRLSWEGLDNGDKEVLLRRSFEALECLPYAGRKATSDQATAFPRFPQTEVPPEIMAAQIENAIASLDSEESEDAAFYEKMWRYGVQSYSIGNLSESSGSGAWGSSSPATAGIVSSKALRLLQPFVQGGFAIRGCQK